MWREKQEREKGYNAIRLIIGIFLVLAILPKAGAVITCPSGYQCMSETDATAQWGQGNYERHSSDICGGSVSIMTAHTTNYWYCYRQVSATTSSSQQLSQQQVYVPPPVEPQCSPPSCKPGETVYCPGTCPNGCGLKCKQLELSCSPPSCGPGETVYCPGTCPNGCGLACRATVVKPVTTVSLEPSLTPIPCKAINQGDTVWIGDDCVNIVNAIGGYDSIAWYGNPAQSPGYIPPDKVIFVGSTATDFSISPELFAGRTGTWYRGYSDQVAFIVQSTAPSCRIVNQGDKVAIGDNCLNIINAVGGYGTIAYYGNPSQSPGNIPPEMVIDTRATESQFFINPDTFTERPGRWYRGYTDQLAFIVTPAIREFIQVNTVTPSEGLIWGQAVKFTGSDTFRNDKNCYLNITGPGLPDSGVIYAGPAINTDGSWTYEWNPSSVPGYPDLGPGTYIVRIMNGAKTDFVKWKLVFVEGQPWQPAQFAGQTPRSGLELNMPFVLTPATWPGNEEPESSRWLLTTGDFFSTFGDLLVHGGTYGTDVGPKTTLDETLPPGYAVCDGTITDLRFNLFNCGKCGYDCEKIIPLNLPNKEPDCVLGRCILVEVCTEQTKKVDTDVLSDNKHCGSCKKACATGTICLAGKCTGITCGEGETACAIHGDIRCVDLQKDSHNCGVCGNDCFSGQCNNGRCDCSQGLTNCFALGDTNGQFSGGATTCVDLSRDPNHCGTCSAVCSWGHERGDGYVVSSCIKGQCMLECSYDPTQTHIVDIFSDWKNCGMCGRICRDDESCYNGHCLPESDVRRICLQGSADNDYCDRRCTNTSADPYNCGGCWKICPSGTTCTRAGCLNLDSSQINCGTPGNICSYHDTCCHGVCTDIYTDPLNCGTCGKVCSSGESCTYRGCINLATDNKNCGKVGDACLLTERCCKGRCIKIGDTCTGETGCPLPYTKCDGRCADTMNDANNCGSCGKVCNNHGCGCENGVCNNAEFNPSDKKWTCL